MSYVLALLLGWVGFSLIKKFISQVPASSSKKKTGQKMLACLVCETYIPEQDAIVKNGKIFCSKEHSE